MIYEEHIELINRRDGAFQRLKELVEEREELFQRTQPGAIRYDLDKVVTSQSANQIEEYAAKIQNLDDKISETNKIYDYWKSIVKEHEAEVNASRFTIDRIYYMFHIKKLPVRTIAMRLYCSESWIYKNLKIIKKSVKKSSRDSVR